MKLRVPVPRPGFPYSAPTTPGPVAPPVARRRTGADFDTEWARRYPARVARLALLEVVMRPAIAALAKPERRGLDRLVELDGQPVIFAANHHSHLDTPLLLGALPEEYRSKVFIAAAADYFFANRVAGTVAALALNAIPIERTKVTRRSAALSSELLAEGWSMVIFPEGGRSPDGWGQPFRAGAAYLAIKGSVPVVPVHLQGTGSILRKGRKLPSPGRTLVTFGKPLVPGPDDDSRSFAVEIEQAVAALADEATTDWWSSRQRAHAGTTPALTGPTAPTWRRAWALADRDKTRRRQRRTWP